MYTPARKYGAAIALVTVLSFLLQPSSVHAAALLSTLSIGSTGTEVMTLQHDLVQLGYLNAAPTGYFGSLTQSAVKAFQSRYGLETVGFVGPQTRSYLNTLSAGGTIGVSANSQVSAVSNNSVANSSNSSSNSSTPAPSSFVASLLAQLKQLQEELAKLQGNFGNAIQIAVDSSNLITQFSASPAVVISGGSATLTWSTQNATSCTGTGGSWSGSQPVNGSATISNITSPTSFTLICSNSKTSQSRTIVVNVSKGTPATPDNNSNAPSVTFTSSATSISSGGNVTLSWNATNATACSISGGPGAGTVATNGSLQLSGLTSSATYTMTCTNGANLSDSESIAVNVSGSSSNTNTNTTPAPTVTLSLSPSSVSSGGSSTITWSSTSATSCTAGNGWKGTKSTSGSESLTNLTSAATYSLTCTGAGGSATQSAAVSIAAPVIVNPSGSTVVHNATELTTALKALNNTGGGTILLAPGNYGDYYLEIQWNLGYNFPSPVTITSQDLNNRATFDGIHIGLTNGLVLTNVDLPNVASGADAIDVSSSQNITIGGIEAHGASGSVKGAATRDSSNVTVKNSEFGGFAVALVSYQDTGDISFLYNHVHDVASDAIDAYQDPGTITIRGNYVHNFNPPDGAHPDCIQTSGGTAASSRVILDENLCVRGTDPTFPPQGVFAGDGPYAYAELDNNLTVCSLYNAIAVSAANSGEVKGNQTISCPDYGTWVRVQSSNGITISGNTTGAVIQPYANTNTTVGTNTIYADGQGVVSDYTQAAPQIAAWRAQHPLVPTDSYKPLALANSKINSTLALGSSGSEVTTLQKMLHTLGYLSSDATGYFGSLTQQAVTSFQKASQLASVGVVGPQTRSLLNSLLSGLHL